MYNRYLKRLLDVLLSSLLLIIAIIPLFIVYTSVLIFIGKPVIFRQKRPGKDEKIFTLYKFRTMNNKKNKNGELLPDKERLSGFGKFLRSTSIDELPELINVIKGDMSLVGPRPLLVEYLDYYSEKHKRRHNVRPGITGLAQVSGRNSISWEEKFEIDVKYVSNVSLILDIKIILSTISKVIKREGINAEGSVSMTKFKG